MTDHSRDPQDPPQAQGNAEELGEYREVIRLGTGRIVQKAVGILEEIDRAAALLGELLTESAPDRRRLLREQPRFLAIMLCELLLARSREAWFSDPAAAVELTELAVIVSSRLDTGPYGEALVEDTRARAWAYRGNALRIASDLRQAEKAFETAEEHHRRAGEDAYTAAEILSFKASLRVAQGLYEEAASLLDPAIRIYREAHDCHREGRSLIKKGTALSYASRHAEAARLFRRGLTKLDAYEEPRVLIMARHNLINCLKGSGRHEEAFRVLNETRGLYLALGEPSHLIRLRWMEGKLYRDLGRLHEAESAFREVREDFIRQGIGLDAALASLDLAMVFLERGETGELKRLAAEMIAVFESREDHQRAMAAFLLFQKAAEAEQVTLVLLQEVASSLEQVQRSAERG
jgi:tetratricopeptide (TPR) repeat protein